MPQKLKTVSIANSADLRSVLAQAYADLQAGRLDRHIASELNNTVGKMNAASKLELEYHSLRKRGAAPVIPFFEPVEK